MPATPSQHKSNYEVAYDAATKEVRDTCSLQEPDRSNVETAYPGKEHGRRKGDEQAGYQTQLQDLKRSPRPYEEQYQARNQWNTACAVHDRRVAEIAAFVSTYAKVEEPLYRSSPRTVHIPDHLTDTLNKQQQAKYAVQEAYGY